ncbi:hypothetical protein BD779DRAFT_1744070 [Infundibulicybe gibba]|nr:hypothetical protein BD779DRAFT_1744070 [Infundibulicybe gibba]
MTLSNLSMQIDVALLAGVAAEGVILGVFLVLDIAALYILVRRRNYHRSVNKPMVLAAAVMFLLSMAQFVVDVTYVFLGFIASMDSSRTTRLEYFGDLTQPIFAARHAIYFTMMLVGDAIVSQSEDCDISHIMLLGERGLEHNMGFVIFSLSFAANTIATSLIAYKIWRADRQLRKTISMASARHSLLPIARIIIESGAINTAYLLTYVIILQSGSNGIEILASIVTPLVGVIFTMVIIRAALAADKEAANTTMRNQASTGPMFAQPGSTLQEESADWSNTPGNTSTEKMQKLKQVARGVPVI